MTTREQRFGVTRYAIVAFGVLTLVHLAFSWWGNVPGYLTYDSGTYHIMVKTLAETGGFLIDNGYEAAPSEELIVGQLRAPDGRLVAQYPETFTILALPFYLVFGWHGLFLLEAVAWIGILVLLHRLALRLFGDDGVALGAVAIYALATFSWEYSQSSYPHLLSTFLVLAAFTSVMRAWRDPGGDPRVFWPLVAGLLAGVAIGVRLDSLFALPGLGLPLLLGRPTRWRQLVALGIGTLPGLAFLSVTNQLKFGTWNPISYGIPGGRGLNADWRWYVPAVLAGLVLLAALLAWRWRGAWWPKVRGRVSVRYAAVVAAVAIAGLVVTTPDQVGRVLHGLFQIVVDLRTRPSLEEAALVRSDGGALMYMDGVKKALLQSCPYLVLLYVPILAAWRADTPRRAELWALWPVPLVYVGIYGSVAWHGSVALNMRYLNPILPFTSLLVAWAWSRLCHRPGALRTALAFVATGALFYGVFRDVGTVSLQERFFLDAPLVMAAVLIALERLAQSRSRIAESAAQWLPVALVVAFAYSGAVTVARDYPAARGHRASFLRLTEGITPHVENRSILFTDSIDMAWGLLDRVDDLYLGRPENDDFETFVPLVRYWLNQDRRVYYVLTDEVYDARVATLGQYDIVPVRSSVPVGEDAAGTWYLIELKQMAPPP